MHRPQMSGIDIDEIPMKKKMMTAKKAGRLGPGAKAFGIKKVGKKAKNMK